MKNVVNLTVKFTIDHYLIRESRFRTINTVLNKLHTSISAYSVASYAELYLNGRVRGAFFGTIYTNVANLKNDLPQM